MILASQIRAGMALRVEGRPYRVLVASYHPGQGTMGGVMHARLRNLETGKVWDNSFRGDLKLEDIAVEKQPMDYLYSEDDEHWFMNPESFEQVSVPNAVLGDTARFLRADMRLAVEFVGGAPVGVVFPDTVEVTITDTAPPARQQTDGPWKSATLDNGLDINVPPFIRTGDVIRIDVANLKYMDRVKAAAR